MYPLIMEYILDFEGSRDVFLFVLYSEEDGFIRINSEQLIFQLIILLVLGG